MRVRGVVPTLQVTDVYGCGSIDRMEKRPLWKLLSLDGLNSQLLSIPTAAELTYGIPNKHWSGVRHWGGGGEVGMSLNREIYLTNQLLSPQSGQHSHHRLHHLRLQL